MRWQPKPQKDKPTILFGGEVVWSVVESFAAGAQDPPSVPPGFQFFSDH